MIFSAANLKTVLLNSLEQLVTNLENIQCKHQLAKYSSNQEAALLSTLAPMQLVIFLNKRIQNLTSAEPDLYFRFQEVLVAAGSDKYFTITELLNAYNNLCDIVHAMCSKFSLKNEAITGVIPERSSDNCIEIEKISETSFKINFLNKISSIYTNLPEGIVYIDCISKLWNMIAQEERQPTPEEFLAMQLAYHVLSVEPNSYLVLGLRYRAIGLPGFRPNAQTYMALTDPGEGHLYGTTRKARWMRDVYVHVEHLERPKNLPRADIESYRVPSFTNFIKVRLHTGSTMPNTFYIGRILQDSGNFDRDLLKVVRTISCALNNAFSIGSAECKISMDKMSTYEAARFMRMIKAEVVKKDDQVLSAAWNLNNELIDDLEIKECGELSRKQTGQVYVDRFEIAKEAIIITSIGGFEKLTWDGASDTYPSQCIVPYQLSLAQAFSLVHYAHSLGLLTYLSAGFKFDEIKVAVFTGIDGVGIGGAQILRYMDDSTGCHGPYLEEHIDGILQKRNEASNCQYGKAVKLLCRLDTMYNEGSLNYEENLSRENLFNELNARFSKFTKESHIREYENLLYETNKPLALIMNSFKDVMEIELESNHSNGYSMAKRIIRISDPLLSDYAESDSAWDKLKNELSIMIEKNDRAIRAFYNHYPWNCLLNMHKRNVFDNVVSKLFTNANIKYSYTGLVRGKVN